MLLLSGLALCSGCRRAPSKAPEVVEPAPPDPRSAGLLQRGTDSAEWSDPALLPLWVPVPRGWELWRGAGPGVWFELRGPGEIQVQLHPGQSSDPREIDGCAWISVDRIGRATDIPALGSAVLATCAPIEPDGDLILSWIGEVAAQTVHIEAHLPPGQWVEGRDLALRIVRRLRPLGG